MIPTITLYQGDCRDILRILDTESVDALVTDPPFGIGFNYDGNSDVASSPEEYEKWLLPVMRQCLCKVRPGGLVAVWQAIKNFRYLWDWFGDDIRIYCAAKNFVQIKPIPLQYAYDPVVMYYKDGPKRLHPTHQRRMMDYHVAYTNQQSIRDEGKGHPCARPIDTVTDIVSNFTLPEGTVLDPFMGSGTTGVACIRTGRSFIGIEISEVYFDRARKRIEAEQGE